MDRNEQLHVIFAQDHKGLIFLSLVDRNGRFKEISSRIQSHVDLVRISEKPVGKNEKKEESIL